MELSLIEVPDVTGNLSSVPLQFVEKPRAILHPRISSGILDGKWSSMPGVAQPGEKGNENVGESWCFASAHSTGEIRIHSFRVAQVDKADANLPRLESDPLYTVKYLGQSDPPKSGNGVVPLCLSLSWDSPAAYKQRTSHVGRITESFRIVSTYSNGKMAIHDVAFGSDQVQLVERDSWDAHTMFQNPSEVWSACFINTDRTHSNVVLSGGDEGKIKVWDVRATTRPMQVLEPFEAGVTCLSPHPSLENIVAVGSCTFDAVLY
jgi:diphthamide biosynthesis protein 7